MVEEARALAREVVEAVAPFVGRGVAIVGLEPSCLLGLRDELKRLLPGEASAAVGAQALMFEEFLVAERAAGRFTVEFKPLRAKRALVHGHCHQKAFGVMPAVEAALRLVPELTVEPIPSSCCGMAGSFGYRPENQEVSRRMAEASLLPAVRSADLGALIVADGTSCRQQIADGAARAAWHVARVLAAAL
jgi:Fe-S oxidoreductase